MAPPLGDVDVEVGEVSSNPAAPDEPARVEEEGVGMEVLCMGLVEIAQPRRRHFVGGFVKF